MFLPYQLTPRALNDLENIWNFISDDDTAAADRVESAILDACSRLSKHPRLGSKRKEISPLPVRFWTVTQFPNFIVVYRPETKPLQVVAILHAKRDIGAILGRQEP
jgi:plasmid stabilization system protein ParE